MDYLIASDHTKIYFKVKGEGIPIIFIHGYGATHEVFRIPEKVLSRKYKIISYDLRGHGLSKETDENVSIEKIAKDIKELIYHLNLNNVVLVGWSLGGSAIFEYLTQYGEEKISKICLVDTSPKIINDSEWNLGLYHGNYTIDKINEDLDLIKTNWLEFSQNFIELMAPNLKDNQLNTSIEKMNKNRPEVMYNIWKSVMEKDYRQVLGKISIPTLVLFGEKSTLYSLEVGKYLNDKIPDSKLIVFEKCTHLLALENPIKFNRVLDEFINNENYTL